MTFLYPIVIIVIISGNGLTDYFVKPGEAFATIRETVSGITLDDYIILSGGLLGTIVSAIVIKKLRKGGYQMF